MEGTPAVAQHLLQLGNALVRRRNERTASLAFASAARTHGVSPKVQAFALYKAALHLQNFIEACSSPDQAKRDRDRALTLLRKSMMLIRNQPSSFNMRLQSTALLERIYTASGNHLGAAQAINEGLAAITTSNVGRNHILRWWVYFRGRAVQNALATGNSLEQAIRIALESAAQCASNGDNLSATAFYMARCQILLSISSPRIPISLDFETPSRCLEAVQPTGRRQSKDVIMFRAGLHILRNLSYLRLGKGAKALHETANPLMDAYNAWVTYNKANTHLGSWNWIPPMIISSLTNHIVANVARMSDPPRAKNAAMVALRRVGIREEYLSSLTLEQVRRRSEGPMLAALAVGVALFDSVARMHLVELNFPQAAKFIAAATRLAFEDERERRYVRLAEVQDEPAFEALLSVQLPATVLTARCIVFALFAEYHSLRGKLSGAHAAMRFLNAVRSVPERMRTQMGELWISDIWQSAESQLSLLTGSKRGCSTPQGFADSGSSRLSILDGLQAEDFLNNHSYATALVTMGVFHMRHNRVLESVAALNEALRVATDHSMGNAQVESNTLTIRSAPGLAHQNVSSSPSEDVARATRLARELQDPVTLARATRQHMKVAIRTNRAQAEQASVRRETHRTHDAMIVKQQNAGMILGGLG